MPERAKIQNEIQNTRGTAQDAIRRKYLKDLASFVKRDVIVYMSGFTSMKSSSLPGAIQSITTEDIQGFMAALHGLNNENLDLILHSPGGSLEAADQIVQYLRSKYKNIRAIIPQNAMSAATMIACACDEIVMGKHSALGPIDPQITFPSGQGQFTAPAQSILDEFEEAKKEIIKNPKTAPFWVNKINMLPFGILNISENTLKNSVAKVKEWLGSYMFSDENGDKPEKISTWLGNAHEHKTHGRPIGIKLAMEVGLKVTELEKNQDFQEKVLSVFHASAVTLDVTSTIKFIENQKGKGWFLAVDQGPITVAANNAVHPKH